MMVVDCGRKFTIAEFEKSADEFAKKRFGSAGNLPPRIIEVRVKSAVRQQYPARFIAIKCIRS